MTTRVMILVGMAWVGVVGTRFLLDPESAFVMDFGIIGTMGPNVRMTRVLLRVLDVMAVFFYHCIVFGGVIPLTWGIYRAAQRG